MSQVECLADFETQLGVPLPGDYRAYLRTHTSKVISPELAFHVPDGPSGIVNYLYTACDLLANSNADRIGDPSRGMMCIGSDLMGGYLYMCARDVAFGHIYIRIDHLGTDYEEIAVSFGVFMTMCAPVEDEPDA